MRELGNKNDEDSDNSKNYPTHFCCRAHWEPPNPAKQRTEEEQANPKMRTAPGVAYGPPRGTAVQSQPHHSGRSLAVFEGTHKDYQHHRPHNKIKRYCVRIF